MLILNERQPPVFLDYIVKQFAVERQFENNSTLRIGTVWKHFDGSWYFDIATKVVSLPMSDLEQITSFVKTQENKK